MNPKIALHGFNNLTKSLSFNIYDICYTDSDAQLQDYLAYIDDAYNGKRLTAILETVAEIIGARVLNVAHADYDPVGASVTMLISEEANPPLELGTSASPGPLPETVVAHLDKSHIAVHTYPESHPAGGISTFRADIDVATCGRISPLKALNYLIHAFESDIVIMDYRVRGFTRDIHGDKLFIDHQIHSIQDFLDEETKDRYQAVDVNVFEENLFHTKMRLLDFNLDDYMFRLEADRLPEDERRRIEALLQQEMEEIFYGRRL
ncbi:MAG: adenosylmethionine decarboxylase [Gammaproteobacteria bacterium]|nr:MAG: adenosylmethionine decarboxylase [Gammaproteobacteria bacterium]